MQIKTTMRYHLMTVRMAVIKKTRDKKCWHRCGEEGAFINWGSHSGKKCKEGPQKIKNRTTIYPVTPLLEIQPKERKALTKKYASTSMLMAASFTTAKRWKQPKCPQMGEWINEYYSAIKSKEIPPFAKIRMDLQDILSNEISQRKSNTV